MGGGVTVPSGDNYGRAFALEFIISFNLMFVVTAVATDTRAVSLKFNIYQIYYFISYEWTNDLLKMFFTTHFSNGNV